MTSPRTTRYGLIASGILCSLLGMALCTPSNSSEESEAYSTPREFLDLYFDFGGYRDPDFPAGQQTIPAVLAATLHSQSPADTPTGPLVLVFDSELAIYDAARQLKYAKQFRATRDSGFFEMTAVSHIGPAIAYLAKIHELDDPAWKPLLNRLQQHIAEAQRLNEQASPHWLEQARISAWQAWHTEIRAMLQYALQMSADYLQRVEQHPESFTVEHVQREFLEGGQRYPIPFNNVMIATFMLTTLQEMTSIQEEIAKLDLNWSQAKVIIQLQAGTNVTAGLTAHTNWIVPFLQAVSQGQLPAERMLIAPYAAHQASLGEQELSQAAYQYYTQAVWGSIRNRTLIAADIFRNIPDMPPIAAPPRPGDYGYTQADQIEHFIMRLKESMTSPQEMLSNAVGFWMAGELQAKQWQLNQIQIPGLTAGFPVECSSYSQGLQQLTATEKTAEQEILTPAYRLPTSGARELTPFHWQGEDFLAVAQLAEDIPGTPAHMNGGNSDVAVLVYRLEEGEYRLFQRIPSHGNESAQFFVLDDQLYLAVASIRSGETAPYSMLTYSVLYGWDGNRFYPVQQYAGFASKNWHQFTIGERHFLALANGVTAEEGKAQASPHSWIYEWNGQEFVKFQEIPTQWAYSWESFTLDGETFLAIADHIQNSCLYRWDGKRFVEFQQFAGGGGRAFAAFQIQGEHYLAWARIDADSLLYRWNGSEYVVVQRFAEPGGRNFTPFTVHGETYLFLTRFITGTRDQPQVQLLSPLYRWQQGQFVQVQQIPTSGGVNAHFFELQGEPHLAVANSLSQDLRFRVDSIIYRITPPDLLDRIHTELDAALAH